MFRRASAGPRDFGRVLIGLALMLTALHQTIELLVPYEDVPSMRLLLGAIATQPILDVLLAAGLTWAAHSSVAVVLVVMSFAAKGTLPPDAAFALVLGANLGTAINPILEGTTGNDPATRRLPTGNLINRVIGVVVALAALGPVGRLMVIVEPDNVRAVADFHTAFNLILALVFFPLLRPYASILRWMLPTRIDQADPAQPLYLDPTARETPVVALGGAAREALRLADVLETMIVGLRDSLARGDRRQISETKHLDDVLDRLNTSIKTYITSIDSDALSEKDHRRVREILTFTTNLEQAGDIVERNLLSMAAKKLKRGLSFSKEGEAEILAMVNRLLTNLRTAASLFMTTDERAARLLAAEKEVFRNLESATTTAHFDRLRSGRLESVETSTLHLDALRDLKNVNTHIVAAAAYPVLESTGELLPSRLSVRDGG
jgi:phosphate:Na+ symporter